MKAIVVSPHPDDETLGACGTVKKAVGKGWEVIWLNITNMKEEYGYSAQRVLERSEEIRRVKEATGYAAFFDIGLQPAELERYPKSEIISGIKQVFDSVRPEVVFLPYCNDVHSDHRIVYDCVLACTKSFRAPYIRKVLCMDILSETNHAAVPFRADCYVDIGDYIEDKLEIASYYKSEFQKPPFPRSEEGILAQARFRGNSCCIEYAEAFQIIREIII